MRKNQIEELVRSAYTKDVKKIYISLDGPRSEEDKGRQSEIIEMINELRRELSITVDARILNRNIGAGAAVISGVDWFFNQENQGIVLEDDLSPDPSFFGEASAFLKRTDVENQVLMFSGTNVFESDGDVIELLRYPVVWGWATSREKWATIRSLIFLPTSELSKSKLGFDFFYWRVGKRRALKGQTKVWDVPLAGAMFSQNYYCAIPPTNLVSNLGDDDFASNTKESKWPLHLTTKASEVGAATLEIASKPSKSKEQFMRRNVFNIRFKFLLSSFFWNFFDVIRWRGKDNKYLEDIVSETQWKCV